MSDTTHSIMKSATRFLSGTMLSRVTGMLRDISMAYAFGTQPAVAAFLVAFRLSHLLRRLFGEGALQSAFIPQFETLRTQSPERAAAFFRDLFIWLSLGLILFVILSMSVLGIVWAYVDLSPGNREILLLTLLLMPSLLFICLFGLNASLLQCEKSYFIPGVAPVAFNIVWIVGVIALWQFSASIAMPWLAGWVILACACQWLITLPQTMAILKKHEISLWSRVSAKASNLRCLVKPLFLAIVGVAATQVNNALDALFARYADPEGPALLWYALRIQQLPLALFGVAIAGALLPPLTRAIKNNDHERFQHFLTFTIRRSVALMVPITAGLFVMGQRGITLLYGHGDFDQASIVGTTQCLWGYGLGLIPMALVLVFAPAFYAAGNARTPALISLVTVVLNIVLNVWMVAGLGLGAVSVAVATSISAWVNLALLAYALPHQRIFSRDLFSEMGKVTLASTFASIATLLAAPFIAHLPGIMGQVLSCAAEASIFLVVLFVTAKLLKAKDLLQTEERMKDKG